MRNVLFIDPVCPKPYCPLTLETEALGGTEATVVRVTESLARYHDVTVYQHNREQLVVSPKGVTYIGAPHRVVLTPDVVILLREGGYLKAVREAYKNAKLYLWAHDLPDAWLTDCARAMAKTGATLLCVSEFHRTACIDWLQARGLPVPQVKVVFNPIDDALQSIPSVRVKKNKLVFFSSPHKGLPIALHYLEGLRRFNPRYRLFVANPGYLPSQGAGKGVVRLGSLPHSLILEHVRDALCVFYPNYVFPETFGLVLAEANAVGTPVLTHPHGAATEVLGYGSKQLVDCREPKLVIDRLESWRAGDRPIVTANAEFRMSTILGRWRRLLA
jgi:glycosyltransferase involved in cell wall biosynthesis